MNDDYLLISTYDDLHLWGHTVMLMDERGRYVRTVIYREALEEAQDPIDAWRHALEVLVQKWFEQFRERCEVVEPATEAESWRVRKIHGSTIDGEIVEERRAIGA